MKGYLTKEGDFWYVNFYTCNTRCWEVNKTNCVNPERNICCDINKLLLDKESQKLGGWNKIVKFELLDKVDEIINNYLGVYAKIIKFI